jgi:hypothetical protein
MDYQAFTNDSLTMMYEAVRAALAGFGLAPPLVATSRAIPPVRQKGERYLVLRRTPASNRISTRPSPSIRKQGWSAVSWGGCCLPIVPNGQASTISLGLMLKHHNKCILAQVRATECRLWVTTDLPPFDRAVRFAALNGLKSDIGHVRKVPQPEVRQMSFLDPRRAKMKDRLAAVSPSLTDARSSSSLERFPRSLIGAIEGSSRFRQSRHECGP